MSLSEERSYWWYKGPESWLGNSWGRAGLAILAGLLATAAWHPYNATLLIFLAFVPLLIAGEAVLLAADLPPAPGKRRMRRGNRFWRLSYLALLTYNVGTTWWVSKSTIEGGVAANVLNAALMTIPLAIYFRVRIRWGIVAGLCVLVPAWMLFEYEHLRWDLTWPWLTLGNTFAARASWVQWYSVTGHLGGTAWVWWVNAILFLGFCHAERRHLAKAVAWGTAAVLLMVTVSLAMLPWAVDRRLPTTEVVAIQPNIDPYTQKFENSKDFIPFVDQMARMMRLSDSLITPETRWVLWPETALDANLNEEGIDQDGLVRQVQAWTDRHPGVNLITGITTYYIYPQGQAPAGARYREGVGVYDVYNTALHFQAGGRSVGIYHKSKLVPGVEGVPNFLKALAINLGGTAGGLGRQPEREVFSSIDGKQVLAPSICYESIFGDFMADFTRNGAQAIALITNDAWWGNTPGHEQHLLMARLRAIEERRWVARSANTGISAFIDPSGEVLQKLGYERMGALRGKIGLNKAETGYLLWGDMGILALVVVFCAWQGRQGLKNRSGFYSRN